MWGGKDGSVTIHRAGNYAAEYQLSDLKQIAGLTKVMPDAFINAAANGVTPAFHDYLAPLLGTGMPVAGRLAAAKVDKILKR
jgi:6-phosphofructokinase 1